MMNYDWSFDAPSAFAAWMAGMGIIVLIICLGISVGLSFIPSSIAKRKGYSAGAFWCLSFFGGFLIPLIVTCCLPDRNVPPPWYRQGMQPVQPMPYAPPPPQPSAQPIPQRTCPQCGASCKVDAAFCLKCGAKLE
jgi:hypothetical protein